MFDLTNKAKCIFRRILLLCKQINKPPHGRILKNIRMLLLECQPDLWVFLSGIVASLGANVFVSRVLIGDTNIKIWLEFVFFTGSSAFCFAAGSIRRDVENKWIKGGKQDGLEGGFLTKKICEYSLYVFSAFFLFVLGLIMILGWNFTSFSEWVILIFKTLLIEFESYFSFVFEFIKFLFEKLYKVFWG